jgi:TonB-linked SusC/RagA family outer membrane protein
MGFAQQREITGTVVNESDGTPAVGVLVTVAGTQRVAVTGADGRFTLRAEPNATLNFSSLGMTTQNVALNGQTTLAISMAAAAQALDEVVVVGYGTMTKKDMTGSVTTVNADNLALTQPQTVQDLLRNNVAGMTVKFDSSAEGNTSQMMIRGKTNFRSEGSNDSEREDRGHYNAPLIVLDDVIYYGRMTDINPNDIERIDVLKDGSSASIYGAKASNGVVIITTKRGKTGKPVIRLDASVGMVFNSRLQPSWGPDDFMRFRSDASHYVNAKTVETKPLYYKDPRQMSGADLETWRYGESGDPTDLWLTRLGFTDLMKKNFKDGTPVDWKKLMFDDVALRQDYTLSVSGSNGGTRHYTSIAYTDNKTNTKGSGYKAIKVRANIDSKINDFITYGLNAQFANQNRSFTPVGTGYSTQTPYDSPYEDDGKTLRLIPAGGSWVENPLLSNRFTEKFDQTGILSATGFLKITLPFGFSVETRFSPYFSWNQFYQHQSAAHPKWNGTTNNFVKRNNNNYYRQQWDNLLKWNKSFGKHSVDFTYLMNWEQRNDWRNAFQGNDFDPNDGRGWHGMRWATKVIAIADQNYDTVQTADALMARANYAYDGRYSFTAAYRRDGNSAFGKNNPHAHFFSGAAAWTFTEESFWPRNEWFTYGKLRLSYGENGNSDIPLYSSLMTLSSPKLMYINPTTGDSITTNAFYADSMANFGLQWEQTTSYNVALDFGLLNDRVSGTIDVYKKVTDGLIMNQQLPSLIGYESVTANIGEVQNTGVELSLTSRNITNKDLSWETSLTYSYNKNRINSLGRLKDPVTGKETDDIQNKRFIGKSIDEIWDYKVLGVWQTEEAEEAAKFGRRPGDFKLDKADWTKTNFVETEDKQFLGSKIPLHRLSMRNSISFLQDFTFSFSLYSYLGYYQGFDRAKNADSNMGTAAVGQPKGSYWTPENRSNDYGRLGSASTQSFTLWRRADFVKIDNIAFGYSVPKKYIEPLRLQSLNVSATLRNGILITGWPGEDPEGSSPIFMYFGLNATF